MKYKTFAFDLMDQADGKLLRSVGLKYDEEPQTVADALIDLVKDHREFINEHIPTIEIIPDPNGEG